MKLKIEKLAGIPIAVVHRGTPCVWELKHNPRRLPRVGDPPSVPPCFIASDAKVPFVKWKRGIELPGPPPRAVHFDALKLRDDFMHLKSDREFLAFLNRVGRFSHLIDMERSHGWLPRELVRFQELFSELAIRSPDRWNEYVQGLSNVPRGVLGSLGPSLRHTVEFHWKGAPHSDWFGAKNVAVIETTDVISTILATIEIDHLRGAKMGACARPDCPMFYEITSRHKRKYCSMSCAHHESVRRMRKRRKTAASKSRVLAKSQ